MGSWQTTESGRSFSTLAEYYSATDGRRNSGAAQHFGIDYSEMERLHQGVISVLETGHLTLDDYLFSLSTAHPAVIEYFRDPKERYGLKIVVVSNEFRELNAHRIHHFGLSEWVDCFVSSCFVGYQKPNPQIFRLALHVVQVPAEEIVFVDNTALHVRAAARLGIRGVVHRDLERTEAEMDQFGLDFPPKGATSATTEG